MDVFETRDPKVAMPHVRARTFVKVGVRGERFWCRVRHERVDGALVAVVEQQLVRSHWRLGEDVVLQYSHVLEAMNVEDELICLK